MEKIIIILAALILLALPVFIIIKIGFKFSKMDIVDEEIHTRELCRRAQELKELGLISSIYDFMVGAKEEKKIKG